MSSEVDWSQILFKISNLILFPTTVIGQVEYGVLGLVVQTLDIAIQYG